MTPDSDRRVRSSAVNVPKLGHKFSAAIPAALFLLLFGVHSLSASPDLAVTDFFFTPDEPVVGSRVEMTAVVENVGHDAAGSQFFVLFEIDGHFHESVAINGGLRAGRSEPITTSWVAEEGPHRIEVFVDHPLDRIHEADEGNNVFGFEIEVPSPDEIAVRVGGVRVAVGSFEDRSGSGWVNVADGVADKLGERLEAAGVQTVQRTEYTETMQREGLNPYFPADAAAGVRLLGADLLLTGAVLDVTTEDFSLSLGPFSIGHGAANAEIVADVQDVVESRPLFSVSASGRQEGTTGFGVDLDELLSLPGALSLCSGGLRTDRGMYNAGESVSIGYSNPGSADWFGVEIHTTTGSFLRWLGWHYVGTGACSQWFWDQRDSFGIQVDPGVYVAKLWDGAAHVETIHVQIQPGWSLFPLFDEVTVGGAQFDESLVGMAIDQAVDRLVVDLIRELEGPAFAAGRSADVASFGASEAASALVGSVAAILPDGRIAVNIGDVDGVARGDFFEVVDGIYGLVRGEIVVVEARDNVSYAVTTSPFEALIGDIVRSIDP